MSIPTPQTIDERREVATGGTEAGVPAPPSGQVRTVAAAAVTRIAIPRPKPGSWTVMFEGLFARCEQPLDYLICPSVPAGMRLRSVQYQDARDTSVPVLRRYLPGSRFILFFRRLKQLQGKYDHLVLMVIDDYNFLFALQDWLRRTGTRERTTILFLTQGMSYFFDPERAVAFYRSLDEIVFITHASYAFERSRTGEIPCEASVVWNGVDKSRFHPIDRGEKAAFRSSIGLNPDGVCFLWLSRDQPKKGLHIVLRAWSEFAARHQNVELAVIGARERGQAERVRFLGAIPNRSVAPYVQMADIYLFPTLWAEGFGLSLAEAMSAGLLAIASDIPPMRELLDAGRYGHLVAEPNVVAHWRDAMEQELARFIGNEYRNPYEPLEEERYSLDAWCRNISALVEKWKARAVAAQVHTSAI
jgi:glycosyltransferase involved in cell wall biosynthesis